MNNNSDNDLYINMENELKSFSSGTVSLSDLANNLLTIRDQLKSYDSEWSRSLTQQIATLDSASSFTPSNEEEGRTAKKAIDDAIRELSRLIDHKKKHW